MPEYVLNRKYTHRSLMGFTVVFEKGEPVFVPPLIEHEVVALGAERVDGETPSPLPPEVEAKNEPFGDARTAAIYAVFDTLVARNDAKDFNAQGIPAPKAVEKLVDFSVDKKELVEMWQAYRIKDEQQ